MTDQTTTRTGLGRRLLLGGALAGAFVAGGLTMSTLPAAAHAIAAQHGGAMMHAGARAHLEKMLNEVDATADQKARIHAIAQNALKSLEPTQQKLHGTHAELHALLTAPTLDRAALERLRAGKVAEVDAATKVLMTAAVDAAEVLTPEQRAKLAELSAKRHKG